jgi:hypothetical protein
MGVQVVRGMPPHEMLGFQPDAFVPNATPEGDERLAIQPSALLRQFVELYCFADMYTAYLICDHIYAFFFSAQKNGSSSEQNARAKVSTRLIPGVEAPGHVNWKLNNISKGGTTQWMSMNSNNLFTIRS